eukprot:TRINITY_DN18131_c0_g1_i2.p1 TRINITY_DN18131_c0_g1~~TRINITY_DN18131_c0_g1_i2.p1  ORF type:complete len:240 (+),score=34.32 TRINITY_DN18131_c0_g1_i2:75-722(+)
MLRRASATFTACATHLKPKAQIFDVSAVAEPLWARSEGIRKLIAKRPLAFAVLLTGAKTCAADILVQRVLEKKTEIDWRRNAVFTIFGLGYLGAFQYVLYSRWFPVWFPGTGARTTASCVVFDQTVNTGLWYYPLFYVVQDCVMNNSMKADNVVEGGKRYCRNICDDMMNCWKLWVPAQIVNFSLVPLHLRAPYAAVVSFLWTCILSSLRGDIDK